MQIEYKYKTDVSLEETIKSQWLKSLYYNTIEDRSKEIHITDLTNPCLLYVVWSKIDGLLSFDEMDKSMIKKTWAGKQLHETAFGQYHEYAFRYKFDDEPYGYIYGSVDEILNGMIIDKKYYSFLPNRPYDHHVEQVLFYYTILSGEHERRMNGKYVFSFGLEGLERKVIIMYIERKNLSVRVFLIDEFDVEDVKNEMIRRAKMVRKGLVKGELPKPKRGSWMCNYCRYKDRCDKLYGGE